MGEGGDPHGYDALVSEVRSSLACAGFRLERVLDWVGKVSADGEITAEADVRELSSAPAPEKQRPKLSLSDGRKQDSPQRADRRDANRSHPGKKEPGRNGSGKQGSVDRERGKRNPGHDSGSRSGNARKGHAPKGGKRG